MAIGATPALVEPRCGTCTTESMTARVLDSNRRHFTQGVFGKMSVSPVMTQHAAQVRKTSDREARQTQRDRPARDHGFTINVTAVPHQSYIQSSGTLRSWTVYEMVTTCTGQHIESGHVLPKRSNSKFTKGLESRSTNGYDSILVWTVPSTRKYMLSYSHSNVYVAWRRVTAEPR